MNLIGEVKIIFKLQDINFSVIIVISPSRISYVTLVKLRYVPGLYTDICVVASMPTVMIRPNIILKSGFVNI